MSLVLDASVALAWCFSDERGPDALRILDLVVERQAVVPPIWRAEIANALLVAQRRGRLDAEARTILLRDLSNLPVRVDPDADRAVWTESLALADEHGISLYDATYLEVARRLRLPLATADRALRRAAVASSVTLA